MATLQERLFAIADREYAAFQAKLTPSVDPALFIGVRVPKLRAFAKEFAMEPEHEAFLRSLPHRYYDENMLHGLLIAEMKNYAACIDAVDAFLPFVDNWAVCDTMSPKVFRKHRPELIEKTKAWILSDKTYTCRFGMRMLMTHYLDTDFKPEYLALPAAVESEEYYVRMMTAWYYATALAKQWAHAVVYLQENRLDAWVHNKTIQKACESYRISNEQKEYLRSLRR